MCLVQEATFSLTITQGGGISSLAASLSRCLIILKKSAVHSIRWASHHLCLTQKTLQGVNERIKKGENIRKRKTIITCILDNSNTVFRIKYLQQFGKKYSLNSLSVASLTLAVLPAHSLSAAAVLYPLFSCVLFFSLLLCDRV